VQVAVRQPGGFAADVTADIGDRLTFHAFTLVTGSVKYAILDVVPAGISADDSC